MNDGSTSRSSQTQLGIALKAARKARGLTLKQVAERTGLALSTVSKIENGLVSLTYDRLLQLTSGLGLELTELLRSAAELAPVSEAGMPAVGRRSLSRPGSGKILETEFYTYEYRCTELLGKRMIPILGEVRARTLDEFGPLLRHSGEEYFHVVAGRVEVHTEFYAPEILETGEGIYLDSNMGHAYLNAGTEPARCICLCTADETETVERLRSRVAEPRPSGESPSGGAPRKPADRSGG